MASKCLLITLATPAPALGHSQTTEPLLCANQDDIFSCHLVCETASGSPLSSSDHPLSIVMLWETRRREKAVCNVSLPLIMSQRWPFLGSHENESDVFQLPHVSWTHKELSGRFWSVQDCVPDLSGYRVYGVHLSPWL